MFQVVLTGPYEHHANMLLWKEFGTTVRKQQAVLSLNLNINRNISHIMESSIKSSLVIVNFVSFAANYCFHSLQMSFK